MMPLLFVLFGGENSSVDISGGTVLSMLVYYFQVGPRSCMIAQEKRFADAKKLRSIAVNQRQWKESCYGGGGSGCNSGWRRGGEGADNRGGSRYNSLGASGYTDTFGRESTWRGGGTGASSSSSSSPTLWGSGFKAGGSTIATGGGGASPV